MGLFDDLLDEKAQPSLSKKSNGGLFDDLLTETPVQSQTSKPIQTVQKQPQLMQKTGASLFNPVKDIYNAVVQTAPQLPTMAVDMVKSMGDDLINEQKRADVVPAVARGLVKGAMNLPANVVNLGVDTINSVANKEVVGKLAPGGDALFDYLNARNDLATMQYEMGERKSAPNQVANTLLGLKPQDQRAESLEMLSEFALPMAGLNAVKGASQVSKVKKVADANKARILSKLDDAQKVKYANSVDKLANKKAVEAVYKKPTLATKVKDEAIFGGATGLTEGETFEERVSNAVAGTALGAGGKLLEAGGAKAIKSKPVQNTINKVQQPVQKFLDEHPDFANATGSIADWLNTDVKGLPQKYKELNHLISKNTSLSKNLTQADLENIKAFKELSPEEQKEVINRITKGDREYASDEVQKEGWEQHKKEQSGEQVSPEEKELQARNEYDSFADEVTTYKEKARRQQEKLDAQKTNEQKTQEKLDEIFGAKKSEVPESNLRHVEETKQPNTQESNSTHVKNDSGMSSEEFSLFDAGILNAIEDLRLGKANKLDGYKGKAKDFKVTKLESGKAEGADSLNNKTSGKEDIYKNLEEKGIATEDLFDEVKEDGVNQKYIKEGFNIDEPQTRASYKHGLDSKTQAMENKFAQFWEKYKKSGDVKRNNLQRREISKLSPEEREYFSNRISEQTIADYEANRPRKVGDESVSNTKDLEQTMNVAKDFEVSKDNTFKATPEEITKANKVLGEAVAKEMTRFMSKGLSFKQRKQFVNARRNVINGNTTKHVLKDIVKHKPNELQKIYDNLIKEATGKYVSENVRKQAIKEINSVFDEVNANVKKISSYEGSRKYHALSEVDKLKGKVNEKDIAGINKILKENNHQLHNQKIGEKGKEVVSDAYKIKAENFLERVRNIDNELKKLTNDGSNSKYYLTEKHKLVQKLREEKQKLEKIIENSYTDHSVQESTKIKYREDGFSNDHYEGTGDVWDRNSSDVDAKVREYKKVISEIDSILYSPEMKVLDKYKINKKQGEVTYKVSPDEVKKIQSEIFDLQNKKKQVYTEFEARNINEKIKELQNKLGETFTDKVDEGWDYEGIVKRVEELKNKNDLTDAEQAELNILRDNIAGLAYSEKAKISTQRQINQQGYKSAEKHITEDMTVEQIKTVLTKDAPSRGVDGVIDSVAKKAKQSVKGFKTFINTIDAIIDSKKFVNLDRLPEKVRNSLIKLGKEKSIKAITDSRSVFKAFDNLDEIYEGFNDILDVLEDSNVLFVDGFKNIASKGQTLIDGTVSLKKLQNGEHIAVMAHEIIHKALREPKAKEFMFSKEWIIDNPDGTIKKIKITEQDIIDSLNANKACNDFFESNKGKIYKDKVNIANNIPSNIIDDIYAGNLQEYKGITKTDIEILSEGAILYKQYKGSLEEVLTHTVQKRFERAINERRQGIFRFTRTNSNSGHRSSSAQTGHNRFGSEKTTKTISQREVEKPNQQNVQKEIIPDYDNNKSVEENLKAIFGNNTKKLHEKTQEYVQSKDFANEVNSVVNSLDESFSPKKTYAEIKQATGNVAKTVDAYRNITNEVEKLLLESKQLTPEQLENRLKLQNKNGEGNYLPQAFEGVNSDSGMFGGDSKQGFFGKKTKYGTSTKDAGRAYEVQLQRYIKIKHAQDVTNFIKDNFSSKTKRYNDDVAVNSKVLQAAIQHGKSRDWVEVLTKGEKAIKEAFKDAETAKTFTEFTQRCGEPDMYIPKNVLKKVLDGAGETLKEQIEQYSKISGKSNGLQKAKVLGKASGIVLDIINNSFKRGVLTSGSFVVNNVFGNQMMLMAKADNPGQYFKGLYEAFKLDNSQVPARVIESTLLDATMNSKINKARKYTGYAPFDNFVNLFDGHLISAKELEVMQKQINYETKKGNTEYAQKLLKEFDEKKAYYDKHKVSSAVSNVVVGLPNKAFKKISDGIMTLNERLERFSRKQAYAQSLDQLKKEKVLTTAQSIVSTNEAIKYIDKSPEIAEALFKRIEDTLGDYENFNSFEKRVLKRVIPFYAWQRTILRHTFNIAKNNPTRVALIYKRLLDIQNEDEDRYDYQKGAIDLGVKDSLSHKNLIINKIAQIPYFTPLQLLNGEHIGSLSNAIRIPAEAMQGKKFFKPSPEITSKQYKAMTYRGKKGYLDKNGKFHEGTLPTSVRANYVAKNIGFNTVYPMLNSPLYKGTPDLITNAIKTKGKEIRYPDKMYDASFGGYYDGEKFAKYKNKWKKRSAVNKLSLTSQLLNKAGLSIQNERKIKKKKDK